MRFLFVILSMLMILPVQSWAFVRAKIENTKVTDRQIITLILETDQTQGEPRWDVLYQDFKVIGSGHSTQVTMVNGVVSKQVHYTLSIIPKRGPIGANPLLLLVPAISIGQEQSEPITLEVYPVGQLAAIDQTTTAPPIMVNAELSQTSIMVGEPVIYSFKLYITPQALRSIIQPYLKQPEQASLEWVSLGEPKQTEERREGLLYQVMEQKFAVFIHEEGEISIPGVVFSALAQEARGAYTLIAETHPIQLTAPALPVSVKSFPESVRAQHPWVASSVSVEEAWSVADFQHNATLKAGDLLTRTVTFKAKNAQVDRLPEMPPLTLAGVNVYPSSALKESTPEGDSLMAKSTQKVAYMFTQPGSYTLPETRFPYWNSKKQQLDEVILPAHVIRVEALESQVIQASVQTPEGLPPVVPPDNFWKWIALGFGGLWALSIVLGFWWMKRKKSPVVKAPISASLPLDKRLKQSIRSKNYAVLAVCLMEWAKKDLQHSCRSLGELSAQVQQSELKELLQALEQILYRGQDQDLDLSHLLALLKQEKRQSKKQAKKKEGLPGLY